LIVPTATHSAFLNTSALHLELLKEARKGACEIVELDIGEQRPMK
jgi:hypothetical protein